MICGAGRVKARSARKGLRCGDVGVQDRRKMQRMGLTIVRDSERVGTGVYAEEACKQGQSSVCGQTRVTTNDDARGIPVQGYEGYACWDVGVQPGKGL